MRHLGNQVLFAVSEGSPCSVEDLWTRIAGPLPDDLPCVVIDPFGSMLNYNSVLSAVVQLEMDGLLEIAPGGRTQLTARGVRHATSLLSSLMFCDSSEDLGDVSPHIFDTIPDPACYGGRP
jgi:hypothetical protein